MNRNRITLFALLLLMVFNLTIPVVYAQQPLSEMGEEERNQKIKQEIERYKKEKEKYQHPKVNPVLVELEEEYKKGADDAAKRFAAGEVLKDEEGNAIANIEVAQTKGGEAAAKEFARKKRLQIDDENNIFVEITLTPDIAAEAFDASLFEKLGGKIIHRGSTNQIGAYIPIDRIRKIADEVEEIQVIQQPATIKPRGFQSEGLGNIRFSNYSAALIRGQNVKIAVIDSGFAGLSSSISYGEIPINVIKMDCTGLSCASTSFAGEISSHGTKVAEVIHDMVPDAQLYLLKVINEVNLNKQLGRF